MRKGVLGSIAALAAGAGAAFGQTPSGPTPAGGVTPAMIWPGSPVLPTRGSGPVIPPPLPGTMPAEPLAEPGTPPLTSPIYPPPGPYGAPRFDLPAEATTGYGEAPRWWFSGEYLLWFTRGQPIRFPLVTTSAPNQGGILGNPTTIELVPGQDISYNAISGFRFNSGFYGDADRRFGPWINAFYTEEKGVNRQFSTSQPGPTSVGIPLLARPFIDTQDGSSSLVTANLAFGVGGTKVSTSTQTWGIEAAGLWNLYRSLPTDKVWHSLDLIAGYKFLQNRERLIIDSFTTLNNAIFVPIFDFDPFGNPIFRGIQVIPIPVPVGGTTVGYPATVQVLDRISVTNRFNGGVFGLRYELRYGMWDLMTIGKVGIGNMHQVLDIYGHTAFANFATGQTGSSFGGLLANASNIGRYNNDEFAVIPELTANLGIHVTRSILLFAGYNFMWISRVARPGLQISPIVDSSTVPFHPNYGQLGRPPAPRTLFVQDELWIHGVNFGMQIRY